MRGRGDGGGASPAPPRGKRRSAAPRRRTARRRLLHQGNLRRHRQTHPARTEETSHQYTQEKMAPVDSCHYHYYNTYF